MGSETSTGARVPDATVAGYFERFCWFVTLVAACIAGFGLVDMAMLTGMSAPQYAAMAAGVCAKAIVPYVFARSVQGWRSSAP